jgi:hypothetical protein
VLSFRGWCRNRCVVGSAGPIKDKVNDFSKAIVTR